jgi:hypothetical protein
MPSELSCNSAARNRGEGKCATQSPILWRRSMNGDRRLQQAQGDVKSPRRHRGNPSADRLPRDRAGHGPENSWALVNTGAPTFLVRRRLLPLPDIREATSRARDAVEARGKSPCWENKSVAPCPLLQPFGISNFAFFFTRLTVTWCCAFRT